MTPRSCSMHDTYHQQLHFQLLFANVTTLQMQTHSLLSCPHQLSIMKHGQDLLLTLARRLMTFAYLSYCNCTRTTMSQRTSSEHGEAWRYYHRSPLFRQLEGGGLSNQLIITRYLLIYIRHIHVEDFRTERDFRTTVVPLATVPSLCICLW